MSDANHVTQILNVLRQDQTRASEELLPVVYQELRKLADQRLSREGNRQTLQATALVHEAYLRLVDVEHRQRWDSRGHFFSAAAEAMRRILVERARHNARRKHGGGFQRVEFREPPSMGDSTPLDLVELDAALDKLERHQPEKCQVVKLRFFRRFDDPTDRRGPRHVCLNCPAALGLRPRLVVSGDHGRQRRPGLKKDGKWPRFLEVNW